MKKGDFVRIWYIGRLESGEIFDLTDEEIAKKEKIFNPNIKYKIIPLVVGAGFVIPGLDNALLKMNIGEKKNIKVTPDEGFGKRNQDMIKIVSKKVFGEREPKQGMVVDFSGLKGRVQSVDGGRVRVDFNNPLAGKVLNYELEVKEKIEKPDEQVNAVLEFFGFENFNVSIEDDRVVIKFEKSPLPSQLKEKAASLIKEYVKPENKTIEKVDFVEEF